MLGSRGVVACVFDLDGVLTTSATMHAAAWAETLDPPPRARRARRAPVRPVRPALASTTTTSPAARASTASAPSSRAAAISVPEGGLDDPPGSPSMRGLANRKNQPLRQRLARQGVAAFAGFPLLPRGRPQHRRPPRRPSPRARTPRRSSSAPGSPGSIEHRVDGNAIEAEHLRPEAAPDTLDVACRVPRRRGPASSRPSRPRPPASPTPAPPAVKLAVGVDRAGHAERSSRATPTSSSATRRAPRAAT